MLPTTHFGEDNLRARYSSVDSLSSSGLSVSTLSIPPKTSNLVYEVWSKISSVIHNSDRSKSCCDVDENPNLSKQIPISHLPDPNINTTDTPLRRQWRKTPLKRQTLRTLSQPDVGLLPRKKQSSDISKMESGNNYSPLDDPDIPYIDDVDITVRVSPPKNSFPSGGQNVKETEKSHNAQSDVLPFAKPMRQPKKSRRGAKTVRDVTNEARIVLDQLLQRSLSNNDTSPLKSKRLLGGAGLSAAGGAALSADVVVRPGSRLNGAAVSDRSSSGSHAMRTINEQSSTNPPETDSYEDMIDGFDDDGTSHSPQSNKTNFSGSSRSSSFHKHVIRPVAPEELEAALKGESFKRKSLRKRRQHIQDSTTSSGASEGESCLSDSTKSFGGARRKKSYFRRAAERVRESLRMVSERERTSDPQRLAASARKKGKPNELASLKDEESVDMSPFATASDNGSAGMVYPRAEKLSRTASKSSRNKLVIKKYEKENKNFFDKLRQSIKSKVTSHSAKSKVTSPAHYITSDSNLNTRGDSPTSRDSILCNIGDVDITPSAPRRNMHLPLQNINTPAMRFSGNSKPAMVVESWLTGQNYQDSFHRKTSTADIDILDPVDDEVDAVWNQPDSIYGRYAEQLDQMAVCDGLSSNVKVSPTTNGPVRTPSMERAQNNHLALLLRNKGDEVNDRDPDLMKDIVSKTCYEAFATAIDNKVVNKAGTDPSWQQVAFLFKMTQSAVQLASFGSKAMNVKEWTLRYFEDRLAGWIVGQGGWESMEDSTTNDEEID